MQTGRSVSLRHANRVRTTHGARYHVIYTNPFLRSGARHVAIKGLGTRGLESSRSATGQKDVTADLLERAFELALSTRLKQHSGIHVDVRSTAWGLLEGKFGGMTVRGYNWRTPLELTAQQLMVDVGELILDYQKLVWQQTVALRNVPQGSVAFTLTSLDLGNFMVHPIMAAAAARAVKGHAFAFDRSTASVRLDSATGRGVITYEGVWAYDGQRYAITMCTPPWRAAAPTKGAADVQRGSAPNAAAAGFPSGGGIASVAASSNTLEQLTVSARRIAPEAGGGRSTTGSYASIGSMDEPLAAVAALPVAAAVTATAAVGSMRPGSSHARLQTVKTVATPAVYGTSAAPEAGAAVLSTASAGSLDAEDAGAQVVAEGLRRFFSSLVINLQGIEIRNPVLLVQQLGPGVGAASAASRSSSSSSNSSQPVSSPAPPSGSSPGMTPRTTAAPGSADSDSSGPASLVPALLTITMKIAILQLPPLNMKF